MLVFKRLIAFAGRRRGRFSQARRLPPSRPAQPHPWQLGLQPSATPVMDDIVWFHDFLLWIIAAITLFVLACC